eukprot:COSAG06_NODE_1879_length_8153_cov_4.066178_3_plen_88_part_00
MIPSEAAARSFAAASSTRAFVFLQQRLTSDRAPRRALAIPTGAELQLFLLGIHGYRGEYRGREMETPPVRLAAARAGWPPALRPVAA